ncbi:MAG: TRC40/GET3/ArsA family transport-energizing ATPase [Acidimicrobiia bacterium]|nr:TRC40/GET3/ArsA family transport-energizing ATPase [Acidimicrobiia bacterium]
MRVLLFTGKGGVGKTTVAAATALRAAESGMRTVLLSTDPAHSLADALDVPLGDEVVPVATFPGHGGLLAGQQLDARVRLEEAWGSVREYVVSLLDWAGADAVEAEELAVIPGLDEVFALADIKALAESGDWDLVVVDCAPTAETLRLLSLPDVLGWYMDRVFPAQRAVTRAVRPLLSRVVSMPIAGDRVFQAVRRFYERLDGVRDLLTDASVTTARLVVNAERMVVAEARRTFTYLSLFGYHVDAVVANRLLPDAVQDPWFATWKGIQAEHLAAIETVFSPLPVLTAELAAHELVGLEPLSAFAAALYGPRHPADRLARDEPMRIEPVGDALVLSLALPFADKRDVDLGRADGELYVAVGSYRRAIALPDSLRRRAVGGARMSGHRLEVEFVEG